MCRGIVLLPPSLLVQCWHLGIEQNPETKNHSQIEAENLTVASTHETTVPS